MTVREAQKRWHWIIAGLLGCMWVLVLLSLVGCAGVGANNIESAISDTEAGIEKIEKAYELVSTDPKLGQATVLLLEAYGDFDQAYHDLIGSPEESCTSRCHHECQGGDVAGCLASCIQHSDNCRPHCCGCKDGTPSCSSCIADCNPDEIVVEGQCVDLPDPAGNPETRNVPRGALRVAGDP